MAAGSPRRNIGPGEQSTCGERMRSPAPGQRLQVTGGILKFTIYQGPFVRLQMVRDGKAHFRHAGFHSFSPFVFEQPGPAFIKRLKASRAALQVCKQHHPRPPLPRTATVWAHRLWSVGEWLLEGYNAELAALLQVQWEWWTNNLT